MRQPQTDTSGALLTNQLYDSQHSKGLFTPKLGLVLRPFVDAGAPGLRLFANVSQGFRQTDGVISDPTLPFIQVWDYEAGIKYDAPLWALDASFFRMDVSNEQTFDPALNTVVGGGQSRRNGLDLGAHWIPVTGVMLHADFTVLDGFYTHFIDPNDGNDYSHTPIFNTSRYTGETRVEFELPGQTVGRTGRRELPGCIHAVRGTGHPAAGLRAPERRRRPQGLRELGAHARRAQSARHRATASSSPVARSRRGRG